MVSYLKQNNYVMFHCQAVDVFLLTLLSEILLLYMLAARRARCWRALPGLCFNETTARSAPGRELGALQWLCFSGELCYLVKWLSALLLMCVCARAIIQNVAQRCCTAAAQRAPHCLGLTGGFRKQNVCYFVDTLGENESGCPRHHFGNMSQMEGKKISLSSPTRTTRPPQCRCLPITDRFFQK